MKSVSKTNNLNNTKKSFLIRLYISTYKQVMLGIPSVTIEYFFLLCLTAFFLIQNTAVITSNSHMHISREKPQALLNTLLTSGCSQRNGKQKICQDIYTIRNGLRCLTTVLWTMLPAPKQTQVTNKTSTTNSSTS